MKHFAAYVTKFAKPIIAIWIVLFVLLAYFAIQLPSKLQGDGFFVDDEHVRVTEQLSETFDLPAKTIFVLFQNQSDEQIEALLTKLKNINE